MNKLPPGLVALPDGVDASVIYRGRLEGFATHLTPQQQRERAFVWWNELRASHSPDAEAQAIAQLAAALGDKHALPTINRADAECRAVKARRYAREAAQAAIENGYQP